MSSSIAYSFATQSTLLQETNRIDLNRITDRHRDQVKRHAEHIDKKIRLQQELLKEQREKRHHEHLLALENHRNDRKNFWLKKTASSPFGVDLYEKECTKVEKLRRLREERDWQNSKVETMNNMTGRPKYDIFPREDLNKISSPIRQIAVERKIIQDDTSMTWKELRRLEHMVGSECEVTEKRFPIVKKIYEERCSPTSSKQSSGVLSPEASKELVLSTEESASVQGRLFHSDTSVFLTNDETVYESSSCDFSYDFAPEDWGNRELDVGSDIKATNSANKI